MFDNILDWLYKLPYYLFNTILALAAILSGLVFKGLTTLLLRKSSKDKVNYSFFHSSLYRLDKPLIIFLPLVLINVSLPIMKLNATAYYILDKTIGILLIICVTWILISVIKIIEDYVHHAFNLKKEDNLRQRKIRTQLQFIRKVAILLIIILSIGAILLSFNSLRKIGTGLLTGVGISGIIVGFAAQRSLANLLAGFQIAITQPIRIDDVLVVEGEWGKVEEINLTYVVLSIWDQRRLILPINYFLEKPFQNWTRNTSEILGTVFLYLDYNAPVEKIRVEFERLLHQTRQWDRRVSALQVTNTTEQTIEVRALMSAANSSDAFDLRCHIREKLAAYVSENYPESLPKRRSQFEKDSDLSAFTEKPDLPHS